MRYKLIGNSLNDITKIKETIFLNRHIKNYKEYMQIDDNVLHDYKLLLNIDKAVDCLKRHLEKNSKIAILVDSDCDGYTSAATLYNYIKNIEPSSNITYLIHKWKVHGLSKDIIIKDDIDLVIIPDAGSNDVEQCKELVNRGKEVLILDHHECDVKNPYAIIVNNQMCDYPNKQLAGVGIVYKFLQAYDEETWNAYADDYLDLVALGNIADNMSLLSYETKRLINKGIWKIRNKFFLALIEKQSYSMNDIVNIINVQFYIAPLINGMIRAGSFEEKELMFRAFIETDEMFKYQKRGQDEIIDEDIYTRMARLCYNAKNRQNKDKEKSVIKIDEEIKKFDYDKNKIIFCNVTNVLNEALTGVTAMKVAEKYSKPCLLLRKHKTKADYYGGSARNIDNSPIKDLKKFITELELFPLASGHPNAFGVEIHKNNIPKAIELINERLKDIDFSSEYDVDFIIDYNMFDVSVIKTINDLRDYYGTEFKEPYVVIENIVVDSDSLSFIGKDGNTLNITDYNGITFIKFRINEDEDLYNTLSNLNEDESICLTVVGRCNLNNYKGRITPQVIINDINILKVE